MNGTGVELHSEDDVSSRAPELLVITLQLDWKGAKGGKVKSQGASRLASSAESQVLPQTHKREVTNTKKDLRALWETSRTQEKGNSLALWGNALPAVPE